MAKIFRTLLIAAVNAIKEFLAFATKECFYSGLTNITNNGCTDLGDGLYSASLGAYMQTKNMFNLKNANSWEVKTTYTYKGGGSEPMIWASGPQDYCGVIFLVRSGTLRLYLRTTGSGWTYANIDMNITMETNETYYFKLGYSTDEGYYLDYYKESDSTHEYFRIWTDNKQYTGKVNSTTVCQFLNWGLNYSNYYSAGTIDFKETSITIDGQTTNFYTTIPEVNDNINLNDGMATSNYDWSAYPVGVKNGTYTQTGTIQQIKQIGGDTVYVTAEPEQDNKEVQIKTGQIYYAYTNENDNTDSVYATDNPISKGTFNLQNATEVGELNKNESTYSGFAKGKYIKLSALNPTTSLELVIKCNPNSSGGDLWRTQPDGKGILLRNSTAYISTSGSGWNIASFSTGLTTMTGGSDTYIKISWNNTNNKITFWECSDGESWIERNSVSSNLPPYLSGGNQTIGGCDDYSEAWNGTVDMSEAYAIVDGNRVNFGYFSNPSTLYENTGTTEFIPTALDPQPNFNIQNAGLINATQVGNLINNNGVYSGFSNSNYIVLNKKYTETPYSFIVSLKTGASLNRIEILSDWSNYFFYIRENYLSFFDGNSRNSGSTQLSTNTKYWLAFSCDGTTTKTYYAVNDDTYNISNLPAFSDLTFWSENSTFTRNLLLNKTLYLGASNEGNAAGSSIDLNNIELKYGNIINTDFYDPKSGIEIGNDLYERNSSADDILGITANIETVDNTTINTVTVSTPTDGYIDIPYYAYTNENDNTDTLYTTDNPISKGIFNLQNATKQGDVKVDANGIISNISSSNYVQITPFAAYTTSFEFVAKVKLSSSSSSAIIGNGDDNYTGGGFVLRTNGGTRLLLWGIYNYSNWDVGAFDTGIDLPTNGDWIWVKMTWDGSKYEFWKSSDGTDYGTRAAFFNSTTPFCVPYVSKIGTSGNTNFYFRGNIDLSETYYIVDGNKTTFGYFSDPSTLYENTGTTEFTPVTLYPQPNFNIQNAGLTNITNNGCTDLGNGLYQGGSGKYFEFDNLGLNTANSWEFTTKFTYNGGGGSQYGQCIIGASGNSLSIKLATTTSNGLVCSLSGDGSNWNITNGDLVSLNRTLVVGNTYYVKFGFTGTKYYCKCETTAITENTEDCWSLNNTTKVYGSNTLKRYLLNYGYSPTTQYFTGPIDLSETYIIADSVRTNFYNTKSSIIIGNDLYERNSTKDDFVRETVPATIETSANITTSNNDNVIIDGSYHLFNLTVPTSMTPIIESSGISYQTSEMPLLLKTNTGVGFLLKDGNNAYYRNTWIINRDYDLHFQEIRFVTNVQDPTITLKINNVLTSAPYYTYSGDKIEYIISKEGYCDYTGTLITSYTSKDGKITTINVELAVSNGTVDVSNYEYTLNNQGNMILTKYKGGTDTVVPNI